jgi:hypothetical protein
MNSKYLVEHIPLFPHFWAHSGTHKQRVTQKFRTRTLRVR